MGKVDMDFGCAIFNSVKFINFMFLHKQSCLCMFNKKTRKHEKLYIPLANNILRLQKMTFLDSIMFTKAWFSLSLK